MSYKTDIYNIDIGCQTGTYSISIGSFKKPTPIIFKVVGSIVFPCGAGGKRSIGAGLFKTGTYEPTPKKGFVAVYV
mgnify:CR=1 FL=1